MHHFWELSDCEMGTGGSKSGLLEFCKASARTGICWEYILNVLRKLCQYRAHVMRVYVSSGCCDVSLFALMDAKSHNYLIHMSTYELSAWVFHPVVGFAVLWYCYMWKHFCRLMFSTSMMHSMGFEIKKSSFLVCGICSRLCYVYNSKGSVINSTHGKSRSSQI